MIFNWFKKKERDKNLLKLIDRLSYETPEEKYDSIKGDLEIISRNLESFKEERKILDETIIDLTRAKKELKRKLRWHKRN